MTFIFRLTSHPYLCAYFYFLVHDYGRWLALCLFEADVDFNTSFDLSLNKEIIPHGSNTPN